MTNITVQSLIEDHIEAAIKLRKCEADILAAANASVTAIKAGNKFLLAGNGGSAADCQHFAAELVGRFETERRPVPAIALTTDSSALTAISNDYGYNKVFARQVEALGKVGDLFFGITTSGKSENIKLALATAQARGMKTIILTSRRAKNIEKTCDICIKVNSTSTARIQEMHIVIIHIICAIIDQNLCDEDL
jgi:D-sedoheptulose 7-phosphate isomerase